MNPKRDNNEKQYVPLFVGLILLITVILLVIFVPIKDALLVDITTILLALGAAAVGAIIPGYLEIQKKGLVRAGGALAIFVLVLIYRIRMQERYQEFSQSIRVVNLNDYSPEIQNEKLFLSILHRTPDYKETKEVNSIGIARFENIPFKFRDSKFEIQIQSNSFELDGEYKKLLFTGGEQFINIRKKNSGPVFCEVKGIVIDKERRPIKGAKVTFNCDTTKLISNNEGRFSLIIKEVNIKKPCTIIVNHQDKQTSLGISLCDDPNTKFIQLK